MTVAEDGTSSAPPVQGKQSGPPRQGAGSRRRRSVLGLLCGAVLLTVGWWWSHPTVFGGVGGEFGFRPERLTAVYLDMMGKPEAGRVDVLGAVPSVRVFGGRAEAEVLLCNDAAIGIGYGEVADQKCFGPGVEREDNTWDQVVLKVTPLDAGTVVVVDGIHLTYSTGIQRGTEHAGWAGTIVFPAQ